MSTSNESTLDGDERSPAVGSSALDADELGRIVFRRRQKRLRRERGTFLAIRAVSLIAVTVGWQIYGSHTLAILFAPLTTVLYQGYVLFAHYNLGGELLYSVKTFAVGYGLGLAIGIFIGMLTGAYRAAEAAVSMYIFALYATPMVALVPIISLWVGYNFTAQVVIVTLFVVWPVTVIVFHGVRQIDSDLMEVSRSLRLNRRQTWLHVLLPGSVPYIITGAAQGVAMGLVGVILAEVQTELTGIGQALQTESSTYHTAGALAVILLIMALGLTLRAILSFVQHRLVPWQRADRGGRRN